MKTTEQLIRKCFYEGDTSSWQSLARAARRFVKAEQREKLHNRIRRQFNGKCKIVVEKGGYNLQDALKRAEQRERKRK